MPIFITRLRRVIKSILLYPPKAVIIGSTWHSCPKAEENFDIGRAVRYPCISHQENQNLTWAISAYVNCWSKFKTTTNHLCAERLFSVNKAFWPILKTIGYD
jgi:hypothetical protein